MNINTTDTVLDTLLSVVDKLTEEQHYSDEIGSILFDTQLTLHRANHPRWRELIDAYYDYSQHEPTN